MQELQCYVEKAMARINTWDAALLEKDGLRLGGLRVKGDPRGRMPVLHGD